jgi:hypothetical protein
MENTCPALAVALAHAGVPSRELPGNGVEIAGTEYRVLERKAVRESDATLIAHYQQERGQEPTIVVAERISASARDELSRAGVAWLDRRGQLWIKAEGLFVNAQVPPSRPPPPRVIEVLTSTGLDTSLALLTSPDEVVGVNELARRIGRSAGRVSEILSALRSEGLVEAGNRPVVPELFWDVAERWKPRWMPLSALPPPEPPERYRLSGTLGAIALGAPLVAGVTSTWPQLYVADDSDLALLSSAYGRAGWTVAEVGVCPSRFGFGLNAGVGHDGYQVTSHLVVALDLAQDRARGREVLENWTPTESHRVW